MQTESPNSVEAQGLKTQPALSFLATEYEKEKQHFLGMQTDHCWSGICTGKIKVLEKPEFYIEEDPDSVQKGQSCLRLAKCDKCGRGYSFWTFPQWVRNRREGAKETLRRSKGDTKRARENFRQAVAEAKEHYLAERTRINGIIVQARVRLAQTKEVRSSELHQETRDQ